ncbi:hypothetical protein [Kitasatospora sp. NPDC058046]|uniref:hypothetical protein n=1 Tax=Kitasatospora sp. NPDC058046 TaxID=3346312 RepID=UPI0036DAB12C
MEIEEPTGRWSDGHEVEPVPEGGGTAEVKPGALLSNAESRRAKPTGERSERLAALGLDWR